MYNYPLGDYGHVYGRIFTSYIALAMNTYYTGKLINLGFFRQMKDFVPTMLNSCIMSVLVYGVTISFHNPMIQLLLGSMTGIVYYILSNILLKTTEWKELISIIRKK